MSSQVVVELLLGVLTAMIAVATYLGAARAGKSQASTAIAQIEADAYNRARAIYEAAIDQLEEQVTRLQDQVDNLQEEVNLLRVSNRKLRQKVEGES